MRRHELDPISLTFGFAFAALGLLFLLGQADQALRLRWVWPLLLLVLGAAILLDIAFGRSRTTPDREVEPGVGAEGDPAPEVASAPDAWSATPAATTVPEVKPATSEPATDQEVWPADPEAATAPDARPVEPEAAPDPDARPAESDAAAAPEARPVDPEAATSSESAAAPEAGPAVDNREHPN
jgi:hypothetical protein